MCMQLLIFSRFYHASRDRLTLYCVMILYKIYVDTSSVIRPPHWRTVSFWTFGLFWIFSHFQHQNKQDYTASHRKPFTMLACEQNTAKSQHVHSLKGLINKLRNQIIIPEFRWYLIPPLNCAPLKFKKKNNKVCPILVVTFC